MREENIVIGILGSVLAAIVLAFIVCIADCSMASAKTITVACYGHDHESSHTYTTTTIGPKGQVGVGVASEPEKWQAVVDMNGQVTAVDCDRSAWPFATNGSTVEVTYRQGRLSTYGAKVTSVVKAAP
jgi:hypothetical protein